MNGYTETLEEVYQWADGKVRPAVRWYLMWRRTMLILAAIPASLIFLMCAGFLLYYLVGLAFILGR